MAAMNVQNDNRDIRIGDVYYMYFEGEGSEQRGWRPGLVFQNNKGNAHSPNIIMLPMTSVRKKTHQPTHVLIPKSAGLKLDSIVLCENPQCVSKSRVGAYITTLSRAYMEKVAEASLLSSSVIAYLSPDLLLSIWKRAVVLNGIE